MIFAAGPKGPAVLLFPLAMVYVRCYDNATKAVFLLTGRRNAYLCFISKTLLLKFLLSNYISFRQEDNDIAYFPVS